MCSDQDLILRSHAGDRDSEEELIKRYRQKVRICARRFYLLGGDDEDLLHLTVMFGVGDLRKTSGKIERSSGRIGARRSDSLMCGVPVL